MSEVAGNVSLNSEEMAELEVKSFGQIRRKAKALLPVGDFGDLCTLCPFPVGGSLKGCP